MASFEIYCFLSLFAIYWIFLTPLSLYWAYRFYQLSKQKTLHNAPPPFIMKRHPKLVIYMVLVSNIYPTIIRPIVDFLRLYLEFDVNGVVFIVLVNCQRIVNLLFIVRLWLLYYDYTHSLQRKYMAWRIKIEKENAKPKWAMRHRWLGNVKVLSIIVMAIIILYLSTIIITVIFIGGERVRMFKFIISLCIGIIPVILAYKIKQCTDVFLIQKECILSFVCYVILAVLYVIVIIVFPDPATMQRLLAMNILSCLPTYFSSLIATHWAIKQYKKMKADANNDPPVGSRLTLEQILSTREGFSMFADHISAEFSSESLFFVFEMVLIKHDLLRQNTLYIEEEDIGVMMDIEVDWSFHETDTMRYTMTHLLQKLDHIMKQYIHTAGAYSINIDATRYDMIRRWNELQNGSESNVTAMPISSGIQMLFSDSNELSPVSSCEAEIKYQEDSNDDEEKKIDDEIDDDREKVRQYLEIFDNAMKQVIDLIQIGPLMRFYRTKEYKTLTRQRGLM